MNGVYRNVAVVQAGMGGGPNSRKDKRAGPFTTPFVGQTVDQLKEAQGLASQTVQRGHHQDVY